MLKWTGEEARILAGSSTVKPSPKDQRFTDPAWQHAVAAGGAVLPGDTRHGARLDRRRRPRREERRPRPLRADAADRGGGADQHAARQPGGHEEGGATKAARWSTAAATCCTTCATTAACRRRSTRGRSGVGETIAATPGAVVHRTRGVRADPVPPGRRRRCGHRPTRHRRRRSTATTSSTSPPGAASSSTRSRAACRCSSSPGATRRRRSATGASTTYARRLHRGGGGRQARSPEPTTERRSASAPAASPCRRSCPTSAAGRRPRARRRAAVTMIDTEAKSTLNMFASQRSVARPSIAARAARACSTGRSMARVFAWVRPNDLVWNYWVANYLLGENPPAFDVLAWNADTTNLPAALHAEFVHLLVTTRCMSPARSRSSARRSTCHGEDRPLRRRRQTDHLVPWEVGLPRDAGYGGESRFVLSNSGHIQALVNPPATRRPASSPARQRRPSPMPGSPGRRRSRAVGGWTGPTGPSSGPARSSPSRSASATVSTRLSRMRQADMSTSNEPQLSMMDVPLRPGCCSRRRSGTTIAARSVSRLPSGDDPPLHLRRVRGAAPSS